MVKKLNVNVLKNKLVRNDDFPGNYFYGDERKNEIARVMIRNFLNDFERVCERLDVLELSYSEAVSRIVIYCDHELQRVLTSDNLSHK